MYGASVQTRPEHVPTKEYGSSIPVLYGVSRTLVTLSCSASVRCIVTLRNRCNMGRQRISTIRISESRFECKAKVN